MSRPRMGPDPVPQRFPGLLSPTTFRELAGGYPREPQRGLLGGMAAGDNIPLLAPGAGRAARGAANLALDMTPVIGDVRGAMDTAELFREGHTGMGLLSGALTAAGAVPLVGGLAKGARGAVTAAARHRVARVSDEAREYMERFRPELAGELPAEARYLDVPEDQGRAIADAYDAAPAFEDTPEVLDAYRAFADETKSQFQFLRDEKGISFEPWKGEGQPYANSAEMIEDVEKNKRLYYFKTDDGFEDPTGGRHPLLQPSGVVIDGEDVPYNDLFRAVHDYFGHAKEGFQFGPRGEHNAWGIHSAMYTPQARAAMGFETRGQNSWVNFGAQLRRPDGSIPAKGDPDFVPLQDRSYAPQKVGLLPEEFRSVEPPAAPGARFDPADPAAFAAAVARAGGSQKGGLLSSSMLGKYTPEEYAEMRTFLSPDGNTGFAIRPDGDVVSVFNAGPTKGAGRAAMEEAIKQGGTKLDAFDGFLPGYYNQFGFQEVRREPNWTPGGPDVVYMERAPQGAPGSAGKPGVGLLGPQGPAEVMEAAPRAPSGGLLGPQGPAEVMEVAPRAAQLFRRPVKKPQRDAPFPGIWKNPRELAEFAETRLEKEDPILRQLFGVGREELSEIANRSMNPDWVPPSVIMGGKGSSAARNVMTPANTQRLQDILHEGMQRAPGVSEGSKGWYVLDPMYQRMEELVGPEQAAKDFERMNAMMGMSSPATTPMVEIPRGNVASYLEGQGRFDEYKRYGGAPPEAPFEFRREFPGLLGHAYHDTAMIPAMEDWLRGGGGAKTAKVPAYIQASLPPQLGGQSSSMVGDAHYARAIGLADTRGKSGNVGKSLSNPEFATARDWWKNRVAAKVGLEAVPAQAMLWSLMGPQTGMDGAVGAPKLEMIAKLIERAAKKRGVSPETMRDLILSGKDHLGLMGAGLLVGGGAMYQNQGEAR